MTRARRRPGADGCCASRCWFVVYKERGAYSNETIFARSREDALSEFARRAPESAVVVEVYEF